MKKILLVVLAVIFIAGNAKCDDYCNFEYLFKLIREYQNTPHSQPWHEPKYREVSSALFEMFKEYESKFGIRNTLFILKILLESKKVGNHILIESGNIEYSLPAKDFEQQFWWSVCYFLSDRGFILPSNVEYYVNILMKDPKEVARGLGLIGNSSTLHALQEVIERDPSNQMKWWAENVGLIIIKGENEVVFYNPGRVDELVQRLFNKYNDPYVRMNAAEALGEIGDERAVDALIKALGDEDWYIRRAAAEALGNIGDKRAVDSLIKALEDENWEVRLAAAKALGYIGAKEAVDELIDRLLNDSAEEVRVRAAESLGLIGEPQALTALQQAVEKDSSNWVRSAASKAIAKIKQANAVAQGEEVEQPEEAQKPQTQEETAPVTVQAPSTPPTEELIAQLSSEDKQKVLEALQELSQRKAVEAVEPILGLLGRDDNDIQNACLDALENISLEIKDESLKKVTEGVLALLKAENTTDMVRAIEELGALKDKRALPVLIRALGIDGSEVRLTALNVIIGFGEEALEVLENYKEDAKVGDAVCYAIDTIKEDIRMAEERKKQEILTGLRSEDKEKVINAIGQVEENNLVEAVEPLLVLLGNVDEEIRDKAREALVQLKDSIEDEALRELTTYAVIIASPDTAKADKIAAIVQLGELKDIRAVDVLARALGEDDIDIKFEVMKTLVKIGQPVIEPLQKYLDDPEISDDVKYLLSQISSTGSTDVEYAGFEVPEAAGGIFCYPVEGEPVDLWIYEL